MDLGVELVQSRSNLLDALRYLEQLLVRAFSELHVARRRLRDRVCVVEYVADSALHVGARAEDHSGELALLFGAAGRIVNTSTGLGRFDGDVDRHAAHIEDQLAHALQKAIQTARGQTDVVVAHHLQLTAQVAAPDSQLRETPIDLTQRTNDAQVSEERLHAIITITQAQIPTVSQTCRSAKAVSVACICACGLVCAKPRSSKAAGTLSAAKVMPEPPESRLVRQAT